MLSFTAVIVLILLAIGVGLWNANRRASEIALSAVKKACKQHELQLLDGSTHFYKCKPKRQENGNLGIMRFYRFEYYDGNFRHTGKATIFALNVKSIEFESMAKPETNSNVIEFPNKHKNSKNH